MSHPGLFCWWHRTMLVLWLIRGILRFRTYQFCCMVLYAAELNDEKSIRNREKVIKNHLSSSYESLLMDGIRCGFVHISVPMHTLAIVCGIPYGAGSVNIKVGCIIPFSLQLQHWPSGSGNSCVVAVITSTQKTDDWPSGCIATYCQKFWNDIKIIVCQLSRCLGKSRPDHLDHVASDKNSNIHSARTSTL